MAAEKSLSDDRDETEGLDDRRLTRVVGTHEHTRLLERNAVIHEAAEVLESQTLYHGLSGPHPICAQGRSDETSIRSRRACDGGSVLLPREVDSSRHQALPGDERTPLLALNTYSPGRMSEVSRVATACPQLGRSCGSASLSPCVSRSLSKRAEAVGQDLARLCSVTASDSVLERFSEAFAAQYEALRNLEPGEGPDLVAAPRRADPDTEVKRAFPLADEAARVWAPWSLETYPEETEARR